MEIVFYYTTLTNGKTLLYVSTGNCTGDVRTIEVDSN